MKERPILFSGPMVRAILDGRKTQTRRVVKLQPRTSADIGHHGAGMPFIRNPDPLRQNLDCPYGQPGDRLWVRETWAHYQTVDHMRRMDGRSFSEVSDGLAGYKADGFESIDDFREHIRLMGGLSCEAVEINGNRWRPSIHMPRWACRLVLEITDVRVERLQAISEADAMAEGAEPVLVPPDGGSCPHWEGFRELWSSINGQASWDANPWVWVVGFKQAQP